MKAIIIVVLVLVLLVVLVMGGGFALFLLRKGEAEHISRPHEAAVLSAAEIRDGIQSPDLAERLAAVEQIKQLPEAERKAALVRALDAAYAPTRLTAVTALRPFAADGAVVERLVRVAKEDADDEVRMGAFGALEESGDPRVLGLYVGVLSSTESSLALKCGAGEALDRLTGRTTAAALAEKVSEADGLADELGMDWGDWLEKTGARARWDAEKKRFVVPD